MKRRKGGRRERRKGRNEREAEMKLICFVNSFQDIKKLKNLGSRGSDLLINRK